MKKHLFWIYIALLETNMVVSMLLQHIPRSFKTNKEGMEMMAIYDGYLKISIIVMFLMFEVFFITSFFVDELSVKRKLMAAIFFVNLFILSEFYMFPLMFF